MVGIIELNLDLYAARAKFSDLANQAFERYLGERGLKPYGTARGRLRWWGDLRTYPLTQIAFGWPRRKRGRRQIIGQSGKRSVHWHYAVNGQARNDPIPHFRIYSGLVFSFHGLDAIDDSKKQHRLRRSFAKWRNARWRDMLLAFLWWLGKGASEIALPISNNQCMRVALPPMIFRAPMSIAQAGQQPPDEDDPEIDYDFGDEDSVVEEDGEAERGAIVMKRLRVVHVREPQLEFRYSQACEYPRDGLYLFGPVDAPSRPKSIRYGVIGTPEGLRRFGVWAKAANSFIDVPPRGPRSKAIEAHHVPFPGFSEAFHTDWPVDAPRAIVDIDEGKLANALRISNRYEAIKTAVDMFVTRLVADKNRQEDPPSFWYVVIPEFVYQLGRPLSSVPAADRVQGKVQITFTDAAALCDTTDPIWIG